MGRELWSCVMIMQDMRSSRPGAVRVGWRCGVWGVGCGIDGGDLVFDKDAALPVQEFKSHFGDKTIVRSSDLRNEIFCTDKMLS